MTNWHKSEYQALAAKYESLANKPYTTPSERREYLQKAAECKAKAKRS